MPEGTILVCDDDAAIRTVLNQALGRAGYDVRTTANAAGLWRLIAQGEGSLVITDVILPDENAFDLLPRIKRLRPDLPVVVMSAQNNILTQITPTERRTYEQHPTPLDLKHPTAIGSGRSRRRGANRHRRRRGPSDDRLPLIGRSPAMQEIIASSRA
jgi:two-component system nitrogen regulation response regulator GlnG